jgi:hypothetical protein
MLKSKVVMKLKVVPKPAFHFSDFHIAILCFLVLLLCFSSCFQSNAAEAKRGLAGADSIQSWKNDWSRDGLPRDGQGHALHVQQRLARGQGMRVFHRALEGSVSPLILFAVDYAKFELQGYDRICSNLKNFFNSGGNYLMI